MRPITHFSQFLRMQCVFLLTLLAFPVRADPAQSCKRRALLVGISKYSDAIRSNRQPRAGFVRRIDDLTAPPLDVQNMLSVLPRYGFTVRTLPEQQATRDAILEAILDELTVDAGTDLCFLFYYSGHGSLRLNTATGRDDETIVTADALLGVPDIRDKELARLFRPAALKGVKITAILDSCHSGSMARGSKLQIKQVERYPDSIYDQPPPSALAAGVLTLGASHSDQLAYEFTTSNQRVAGGAFTQALVKTLSRLNPDAPAQRVYDLTLALMPPELEGEQEPILEALPQRRARALFGWEASELSGQIEVAVTRVIEPGTVVLQAGFAIGVEVGAELVLAGTGGTTAPRLRVGKMLGPSASMATLIQGSIKEVRPGMSFTMDKWLPPAKPSVRLRLTASALTLPELISVAGALSPLNNDPGLQIVVDPTATWPTHRLRWQSGEWQLQRTDAPPRSLGAHPTAAAVLAALLPASTKDRPQLSIEFPLPKEMVVYVPLGKDRDAGRIVQVDAAQVADYELVGHMEGAGVSYAWIQPYKPGKASLLAPGRTDWVPVAKDASAPAQREAGRRLIDLSRGLARILGWQNLNPPEQKSFPYRLAFIRQGQSSGMQPPPREKPVLEPFSTVYEGEHFAVQLVPLAPATAQRTSIPGYEEQYVYLFAIDSCGASNLLIPAEKTCSNNEVVLSKEVISRLQPINLLNGIPLIYSKPPEGLDVFILLTTNRPLTDPCILTFDGTRSRGDLDELSKLLLYVGEDYRGVKAPAPKPVSMAWSIQRLPLFTKALRSASGSSNYCK